MGYQATLPVFRGMVAPPSELTTFESKHGGHVDDDYNVRREICREYLDDEEDLE